MRNNIFRIMSTSKSNRRTCKRKSDFGKKMFILKKKIKFKKMQIEIDGSNVNG